MENKVIYIIIDGLKYSTACDYMGKLEHLIEKNQAARYKVRSELPAESRPLYEVLLTGIPAYQSGIVSNNVVRNSNQKSLFHLTKENGLRNAAAAYLYFSQLYNHVPFDRVHDLEQDDESK